MESSVAQSASRPRSIDISSLSPEILLPIFSKLNSKEVLIFRRTCKKWLDIIDTNKSLWRNLEWIGGGESIEKAVEVFDEKSASSLEMISIEEDQESSKDLQQLVAVITSSKGSLKSMSILTFRPHLLTGQLLELALSSSAILEKLVLWDSQKFWRPLMPLTHLTPTSKRADASSSSSRLRVLWLSTGSSECIEELLQLPTHLFKSLVSLALFGGSSFQEYRPLLPKSSEIIVHLSLSVTASESQMEQPLFYPNLKVLEGQFRPNVSFYFDCPNLKHLILFNPRSGLHDIPSSVEQLWVRSSGLELTAGVWEPLSSTCPNMESLRVGKFESRSGTKLQPEAFIQVLEKRQEMVNKREQIQGLNVVPLQKLVLPIASLSEGQLERARKVAGDVVDIQDYPDFIELRY